MRGRGVEKGVRKGVSKGAHAACGAPTIERPQPVCPRTNVLPVVDGLACNATVCIWRVGVPAPCDNDGQHLEMGKARERGNMDVEP